MRRRASERRRAIKYGVEYDKTITIDILYERDLGLCKICGDLCERDVATVDHIIPISKGGAHTWDNVQLAHFLCNTRKGAKVTNVRWATPKEQAANKRK